VVAVSFEALATALHDLFSEHDLDRRVRIGVANQRIVVRTLELPPISDPKELAAAIRFQAPEQVPMPLDQAVLDHVVLGMAETPAGPRMRVLLVAARRDMIERLLSTARSAGLKPEGIDLAAFAMVRALPRSEDTVLQLAVGGVVNMAVARRGQCLFTRVVGGGLEAMAVELAERSSITLEEARESVITDGVTGEGETQVVVADGIRRIAGEVRNSIDFHLGVASTDGDTAVARVLLTGMAAPVPGFAEALSERLSLPVETAAPITRDAAAAHRFTVAAGLAVEEAPGA
jgi:type IV pilus assembly protein PilM